MKYALFFLLVFFMGCSSNSDWRTANRDSANIAPKADVLSEAIVQVYYARAYNWRGYFGVHPWISWKLKGDSQYTVAQILGYRIRRGMSALSVEHDIPDRRWFGNEPTLLFDARGEKAEKIIAQVKDLVEKYPHKDKYVIWPGPNSNTFVDYVIRNVDEMKIKLPPHAIGKDYPVDYHAFSMAPAGTGAQFSLFGLLGLTLGAREGVELNVLGLNFGVDFYRPALKFPMIGRIGMNDAVIEEQEDK